MELITIAGIILLAYIGAVLVLMYNKDDYKGAFVPGTIAWVIVVIVNAFIALEVVCVLILALILGIVAQYIASRK